MVLKFSFFKNDSNNSLNSFTKIMSQKNFQHVLFNDLLYNEENKLIIFNKNHSLIELKKLKKILNIKKNHFVFLFLPKNFPEFDLGFNYIKIMYPISIDIFFKTIVDKISSIIFSYKDVFIGSDNFMINSNNEKKVYLTETEIKIIQLLYSEKIVKKEKVKFEILNVIPSLHTKSLESHISRLRKKLLSIDSHILINSRPSSSLEII